MNFIPPCGWSVRITSLSWFRVLKRKPNTQTKVCATTNRGTGFSLCPASALFAICALAWGELPAPEQAAIDHISAESLRTSLTYIASDELEGRNTPSHGLDLAADYIAAQFKRAGLEPAAGDSYFQSAKFAQAAVSTDGLDLTLSDGKHDIRPQKRFVRVRSLDGLDLSDAPVVKLPGNGTIPPVAGMIVAGDARRWGMETAFNELQARKPALILLIDRSRAGGGNQPDGPTNVLAEEDSYVPTIRIRESEALSLLTGKDPMTITVHLKQPVVKQVMLRNVVGLLRGSDPALRDQYLLLTAHYDHLGKSPRGIFHGANDDGSGTVSVMEIASALATMNPRPKRSILFMTVFGEEEGLMGSSYYAHHPLVPLKTTVADINLEQIGRTDEKSGREERAFAFTGPSFSDLPEVMTQAAKAEGIRVYRRGDADDYFDRSDNYSFAQFGVIAHTIAVAFEYPDYHALGDTVDKIDFVNMAAVDRGVAAGIIALADETGVPRWSDAKGAGAYRAAGNSKDGR